MRITKRMLCNRMEEFCKALGVQMGYKPGNWNLDNYPMGGGWIVVEFMEQGAEHHPLTAFRMKASAMYDALYMATAALQLKNRGD